MLAEDVSKEMSSSTFLPLQSIQYIPEWCRHLRAGGECSSRSNSSGKSSDRKLHVNNLFDFRLWEEDLWRICAKRCAWHFRNTYFQKSVGDVVRNYLSPQNSQPNKRYRKHASTPACDLLMSCSSMMFENVSFFERTLLSAYYHRYTTISDSSCLPSRWSMRTSSLEMTLAWTGWISNWCYFNKR